MAEELFDIYFSGRLMPGADLEAAKRGVAEIFKANEKVIAQLFSGSAVKIKKAVDMDTAIKYRVKFREAGAVVDIRPVGSAAPVAGTPATAPPVPTPAVSETTAQTPTSVGTDNTSDFLESDLAPPGSQIDDKAPPPPVDINTDTLSAAEPNSGSLEAYAIHQDAVPLPDISSLTFGPDDEPLDTTPEPAALEVDISALLLDESGENLDTTPAPPALNVDIRDLTMSEANTGSLEEFDSRPDAAPLPDISQLKLAD